MSKIYKINIANRGKNDEPKVALTFDDGPNQIYTPKILKILEIEKCKATFFLIGRWADKYPEIVKKIISDGHCIGNHTYTHGGDSDNETFGDFQRGKEAIEKIINKPIKYTRVPGFLYHVFNDHGYRCQEIFDGKMKEIIVDYSILPGDWIETKTVEEIINNSIQATNGDIIDLHDGSHRKKQQNRPEKTWKALPEIIKVLKGKGLQLLGLDEITLEFEQKEIEIQ